MDLVCSFPFGFDSEEGVAWELGEDGIKFPSCSLLLNPFNQGKGVCISKMKLDFSLPLSLILRRMIWVMVSVDVVELDKKGDPSLPGGPVKVRLQTKKVDSL